MAGQVHAPDRRWLIPPALVLVALGIGLYWLHPAHPVLPFFLSSMLLLAIVAAGVVGIRTGVFGPVVIGGRPGRQRVSLTFDDGPDPVTTMQVADLLEERGLRATFFVVGHRVEQHPHIVRELVERGHEVGIHSFAHTPAATNFSVPRLQDDFTRCSAAVNAATDRWPRMYRPPVGLLNPRVMRAAKAGGWVIVGWTVGAKDGIRTEPARVVRRVTSRVRDGDIVLMHDRLADGKPAALEALPPILDHLESVGLRSVPLSELLGESAWGSPP